MEAILTSVGQVFTSAIEWVGTVASTVTSTPILLVFAIIPLVGLGVGLFRRLLSVN
ncbi:hypothetical protein IJ472_06745 [bacterium]|nr:hypothetical protein [bacterium]